MNSEEEKQGFIDYFKEALEGENYSNWYIGLEESNMSNLRVSDVSMSFDIKSEYSVSSKRIAIDIVNYFTEKGCIKHPNQEGLFIFFGKKF